MEAIWVAAEMRAGAAYAHSLLALDTISHSSENPRQAVIAGATNCLSAGRWSES
jgi:hypothetical protein